MATEFGPNPLDAIREGFIASVTNPSRMPLFNRVEIESDVGMAVDEVAVFIPGADTKPGQDPNLGKIIRLSPKDAAEAVSIRDSILKPH